MNLGIAACRMLCVAMVIALATALGAIATPARADDAQGTGTTRPAEADNGASAGGITEIIVTAQKRQESIQDVPIAVSAFSQDDLQARRLDGGQDLQLAIPNMTFSRQQYGTSNFQIRGIGYQVVSTGADDGVGVHENNVPLSVNRLADSDFYDMQRVEVLRGPQGTLYGRNATGGVINLITAKPTHDFDADITLEAGNYSEKKLQGFVNIPMGEIFALRLAGFGLRRDGFETNALTGTSVDGRDLWSTRATLSFTPTDNFHSFLMWEHFKEDDDRTGGNRVLCEQDPGPTGVGGVPTNPLTQSLLSRGCQISSIYSPATATGTVNSVATLAGVLGVLTGIQSGNAYQGAQQSSNLRTVEAFEDPIYRAKDDVVELNFEWDLGHGLTATSLASYLQDSLYQQFDGQGVQATQPFNNTPFTPGGVLDDPQYGPSMYNELEDINNLYARQWTQELRLQSSFDSPWNFNLGGIYIHLTKLNDVYFLPNTENVYAECVNIGACPPSGSPGQIYIDTLPSPDGTGHNYYISRNPYDLKSAAAFGEVYYQVTPKVKLTGGLRYTNDDKNNVNYPVELLLPGRGWPVITPQHADFQATTGRFNVDYHITDDSLVYASYSKGYKGGGFNAPDVVATSPTYKPEFVNAYEIGSKNTLFNRTLLLNVTAFHYDYKDYQISENYALTAITANVDAKINGAELETTWQPTGGLQMNVTAGYLTTRIENGSSVNPFDRTQGDPNLTEVKTTSSACVSPTADVAALLAGINAGAVPPTALLAICDTLNGPGILPNSPGVPVNLSGKQLPNAPHFSGAFGAQYQWRLSSDWNTTLRADYSWQSASFAEIYNESYDRLRSWDNTNITLGFDAPAGGWKVQLYTRNVFNKVVITNFSVQSDALGLGRTINLLDPRTFGLVVSKSF
jgi:outer membrane receptor protein involved in Fe transport